MNLQLVLGSEAYGVDADDAAIVLQKDVKNLKPGSHLALLDGAKVYASGTDMGNVQRVQIVAGITGKSGNMEGTLMSVPIDRRSILSIDREGYTADTSQVIDIAFASILDAAEGEVTMSLFNNSYDRTVRLDRINISITKKAGTTAAALVTAIAAKINAHANVYPVTAPFVTATVNTSTLRLTMANSNIDFSMIMDGLAAGLPQTVVTPAFVSLTNSEDILRTEKEYSGNLGNGNYATLGDQYWSFPQQTVLSTQYDVFNIKWQGEHDTPQNRQRSAVLWLKIAVPTGATADAFSALLKALFSTSFDQALGTVEPVKDNKIENDGNPAT